MNAALNEKFDAIEEKFLTGKIKEALHEIDLIEKMNEASFEEKVICKRLKSQLYYIFQPFTKAIKFGEEATKESIETENNFLIFDSAFYYGRALCISGKLDVGTENLQFAKDTLSSIKNKNDPEYLKRQSLLLCHYKGWRDGFEVVFKQLSQALKIAKKINYHYGKVSVLYELASLYQWYGNHFKFNEYLELCLELAEKFNYKEYIMWSLIGLGTIHLYKGDLDQSLRMFSESFPLAKELESSYALSFILGDLGFLYWHKQNQETALRYYTECIQGLEKAGNTIHRQYPWMLFRSILVLLDLNNHAQAEEYLRIIQSISDLQSYRPQHLSHKLSKLSKAIVLKNISSDTKFQEIFRLLEEVAYDTLIHDELNKTALYHLCDSYFRKLIESNDLDILDQIKDKVKDLENMAKKQSSSVLLAEALLLDSQLSLLELEIDAAKLLLLKAQKIAEEREIHRLANLISNAYDNILDNVDQWETASSLLPDISDRMELTHIEQLLYELVRNKIIYSDIEKEDELPCAFIILSKENSLLFAEIFDDLIIEPEAIEGIMPKIHSITNKNTNPNPVFERARYNGYTLIVDEYQAFIFCYVFIGKSYSACLKLKDLMKDVQDQSDVWKDLLPKLQRGHKLISDDRFQLTNYLRNLYKK